MEGFEFTVSCSCPNGVCLQNDKCSCRIVGQGCHRGCHSTKRKKRRVETGNGKGRGRGGSRLSQGLEDNTNNSASETAEASRDVCDNPEWYFDLLDSTR